MSKDIELALKVIYKLMSDTIQTPEHKKRIDLLFKYIDTQSTPTMVVGKFDSKMAKLYATPTDKEDIQ